MAKSNKNGITLLGLGPGDPNHLTRRAWQVLEQSSEVYLRTDQHPAVAGFPAALKTHSFDDLYESQKNFEDVYEQIVAEVLELGKRPGGVVYAVPGDPYIAEATGPEIARRAAVAGIPIEVVPGVSFLEPAFAALGLDPFPQISLVDAFEIAALHHPKFPPHAPALIAQLYSKEIAAQVKLVLMEVYPDEFEVRLVHAAGSDRSSVETLPLHAIDQSARIASQTSLYVPALGEATAFEEFQELIAHLRSPEGCPWDREQTHQSLRRNLLEEAYEALEALDTDDPAAMREEFGDLLLQIVLQAQIASEYGEFRMADVFNSIHTKLVRRHPHVFGDLELDDAGAVRLNWERLKAIERAENGGEQKGLLTGVPVALPALSQAEAYQQRAARVGFDWPHIEGVLDKINEEIEEVRRAQGDERALEIGDLFFALVNLARWYDLDPESALRETNQKFRRRFETIEQAAKDQGREIGQMTLEEMDAIWEAAKGSS
jgi:tetrapyrrole methylase family protein/MazG family protein